MLRSLACGIASVLACAVGCQGGKPTIEVNPRDQYSGFSVSPDASSNSVISDVEGIDAGCVYAEITGQLRSSNLFFLLDRSGSMACNLPENGQSSTDCAEFPVRRFPDLPSKWDLTLSALDTALQALRKTGRVRAALSGFPVAGTECTIAQEPQLPFEALDDAALNTIDKTLSTWVPYGNTPLVGATILGYQYILDLMRSGTLDGENFVVLIDRWPGNVPHG